MGSQLHSSGALPETDVGLPRGCSTRNYEPGVAAQIIFCCVSDITTKDSGKYISVGQIQKQYSGILEGLTKFYNKISSQVAIGKPRARNVWHRKTERQLACPAHYPCICHLAIIVSPSYSPFSSSALLCFSLHLIGSQRQGKGRLCYYKNAAAISSKSVHTQPDSWAQNHTLVQEQVLEILRVHFLHFINEQASAWCRIQKIGSFSGKCEQTTGRQIFPHVGLKSWRSS